MRADVKRIQSVFLIDHPTQLKIAKDSSIAIMEAAIQKNWYVWIVGPTDVYEKNGDVECVAKQIDIRRNGPTWFEVIEEKVLSLADFDIVWMRKDPPVDYGYIALTLLLEKVSRNGTLVVNHPAALRSINEKMCVTSFPDICAPTLISNSRKEIESFLDEHKKAVVKPLNSMGGDGVFLLHHGDRNIPVILESVLRNDHHWIIAQEYINAIESEGDKRIILINGIPVEMGIVRKPGANDHRGNMVKGATIEPFQLSEQDLHITRTIAPFLKSNGILFAGIDIIGTKLTEINITSPTGIREIAHFGGPDVASLLIASAEQMIFESSGTR